MSYTALRHIQGTADLNHSDRNADKPRSLFHSSAPCTQQQDFGTGQIGQHWLTSFGAPEKTLMTTANFIHETELSI